MGREAVSELERCGIVVDISHLSDAGLQDVLDVARKPVIASHSSCRALHPHPRNLTDAQIKAIALSGGLVCLNAVGGFLSDLPSLDDYVDHIAHAASLIGDGAVGIGADFMDEVFRIVDPILGRAPADEFPIVPKLQSPADYRFIGEKVARRLGFASAQGIMGENLIRFLSGILA